MHLVYRYHRYKELQPYRWRDSPFCSLAVWEVQDRSDLGHCKDGLVLECSAGLTFVREYSKYS